MSRCCRGAPIAEDRHEDRDRHGGRRSSIRSTSTRWNTWRQRSSSSTTSASAISTWTAPSPSTPTTTTATAGRLHPDRPIDQQHGRRRAAALRAAPVAEHPLAGARRQQGRARRTEGPEALRAVVHRLVGRRQVDHRQPGREAAATPMGRHTYLLDGDNVRHGLNKDLGFTEPTASRTSAASREVAS